MDSALPEELLKKLKEETDKPRELSEEERRDMREGMSLYEMVQGSPGWGVVKKMLESRAYHTWVDPRETKSKEEWEWRELNCFYAADVSKQLLEVIQEKIDKAFYLQKVASGEIRTKQMKI